MEVCGGSFAGSRPHPFGFRTDRVVNPLAPSYPLPKAEIVAAVRLCAGGFGVAWRCHDDSVLSWPLQPEPKFVRDSFDASDIEGTKSKPMYKFQPRDSFNTVRWGVGYLDVAFTIELL